MTMSSRLAKIAVGAVMLSTMQPAYADVKAGVDAWSRGEYEIAVKQWREAALKGDPDAQFNMGQAHKMGRGVKTDLNVALDWYKLAAAQGHLRAADSYGHLLHYQGKVSESLTYLQSSAERGDPRAQYLLGTELFNGVHIKKDWVRAYALMTRASSAGMGPASRSLAQMDQYVPIEQRQQATVLAGELEQRSARPRAAEVADFPIKTTLPPKMTKTVAVPPSKNKSVAAAGVSADIAKTPKKSAEVAPTKPAVVNPAPVKTAKVGGNWRIQLGAFGDEGNAKKLWTKLQQKIADLAGLQPYFKAAGNITRLQAGPFAKRSVADAICNKVKATGQACIAVES